MRLVFLSSLLSDIYCVCVKKRFFLSSYFNACILFRIYVLVLLLVFCFVLLMVLMFVFVFVLFACDCFYFFCRSSNLIEWYACLNANAYTRRHMSKVYVYFCRFDEHFYFLATKKNSCTTSRFELNLWNGGTTFILP